MRLPTTNLGLVWTESSQWGSLRYAGNFAMFALQAGYYGIQPEQAFKFAEKQINYALGDAGHSFVCGFGHNPPKRPHHRFLTANDFLQNPALGLSYLLRMATHLCHS